MKADPSLFTSADKVRILGADRSDPEAPVSVREVIDLVWDRYASFAQMFFPKRWKMPAQHHNPESVLVHIFSQTMAAKMLEDMGKDPNNDRTIATWTLSSGSWRQYGSRVYALDARLGEGLLRTTPKGFSFSAIHPPLPTFLVMLPMGLLQTSGDGDVTGLLIGVDSGVFSVCAMLGSGASYTFFCPCEDGKLAELLSVDNGEDIYYQQATEDIARYVGLDADGFRKASGPRQYDGDGATLRLSVYLALNILAYLSTPDPDVVEERFEHCFKPRRKPNPQKERDFYIPFYIGEKYGERIRRRGVATAGGTHASPTAHWRAGHWRQQAYGKGRKLRRMVHIEPVLVGAK